MLPAVAEGRDRRIHVLKAQPVLRHLFRRVVLALDDAHEHGVEGEAARGDLGQAVRREHHVEEDAARHLQEFRRLRELVADAGTEKHLHHADLDRKLRQGGQLLLHPLVDGEEIGHINRDGGVAVEPPVEKKGVDRAGDEPTRENHDEAADEVDSGFLSGRVGIGDGVREPAELLVCSEEVLEAVL